MTTSSHRQFAINAEDIARIVPFIPTAGTRVLRDQSVRAAEKSAAPRDSHRDSRVGRSTAGHLNDEPTKMA
jgi:hypothetical protein